MLSRNTGFNQSADEIHTPASRCLPAFNSSLLRGKLTGSFVLITSENLLQYQTDHVYPQTQTT